MPAVLLALQALAQLEPLAAALIPAIEKLANGTELNDTDLANLDAATQQINAAVAAKAQAASDASTAA